MGIERKYIDFIENYNAKTEERKVLIDYYAMTTLGRMIWECENYVKNQKKSFAMCKIF